MLIKHVKLFYQIEFNKSNKIKSNSFKRKSKENLPKSKNNEDKSLQGIFPDVLLSQNATKDQFMQNHKLTKKTKSKYFCSFLHVAPL